ncbi:hypothetical protein [Micromonospora echinofusca]|uniref:Fluoride ion transporter CrcB n=1 Tax=Micromonospora echinofusca TaxID=47858 RepID=A0ABS3VQK3_MICEH|nr:hypothetical protein [Micromonospora echinofusca]MBO4206813.1 hypothetical protein [Micromonospora echinofusca]
MMSFAPARRPSVGARRFGYLAAITVNVVLLTLINGRPGWRAVPFLTDAAGQVVGLVNASIVAGVVVTATYLRYDAPWWRSLGDLATSVVGLAALVRLWEVFPFAFPDPSVDWPLVARVVLAVSIAGTVVGIVVQGVTLLARLVGAGRGGVRPAGPGGRA